MDTDRGGLEDTGGVCKEVITKEGNTERKC